ncbi:MAG: aminoglycoside phosphotransferase family protein [Spirochaetales bacterium]|nr:aminoglycoside phosphotransferase family protein [Spirochaetales bacterium]
MGTGFDELISQAASAFALQSPLRIREAGGGKINRTFIAAMPGGEELVFQSVNTRVFPNPSDIMENIGRITAHIRAKSPGTVCLEFLCAPDGKNYAVLPSGFWRVSRFIPSVSYATTRKKDVIRGLGEAAGSFLKDLSDFDASALHTTIADFHNTTKRLSDLQDAFENDALNRVDSCKKEIDFVLSRYSEATLLDRMKENGDLPLRVTHNDTKLGNVLFDKESGKPLCLIDLDTVMPGLAAHDFGDSVRSAANKAGSACTDYDKVGLGPVRFQAYAEGYLSKAGAILTEAEKAVLAPSGLVMALEQSARYLTDYLSGDTYFRTSYPGQNLDRARNQIAMAADMEKKMPLMRRTVARCCRG